MSEENKKYQDVQRDLLSKSDLLSNLPEGYVKQGSEGIWESKYVDLKDSEQFSLDSLFQFNDWKTSEYLKDEQTLPPSTILSGTNSSLEEIGLEISSRRFPEGYGYLYFKSEDLGENSFMTLKFDTQSNRVLSIAAFSPAIEIQPTLQPIVQEESGVINNIFKYLELSKEISNRVQSLFISIVEERRESRKRRNELLDLLSKLPGIHKYIPDSFAKQGVLVSQGEYAIETLSENVKTLRTFALGPCVSLVLYQPDSKMGALYHIDTPGEEGKRIEYSINYALKLLKQHGIVKAYLVGGDGTSGSNNTIQSVVEMLPSVKIIEKAEIGDSESQNVVLDLDTGDVGHYSGYEDPSVDATFSLMRAQFNAKYEEKLVQVSHKR